MKAVLAFTMLMSAFVAAQALSDEQMAQIRQQAEAETKSLFGYNNDARSSETTSPLALEKATARIEAHLLKGAAHEAIKANWNSTARRRLLYHYMREPASSTITPQSKNSFVRRLLSFIPSASRPSSEEAAPYCSFLANTSFDIPAGVQNIADAYQKDVTDPGQCCAACLFRKDCFGWTIKSGLGDLDGCYLRGENFKIVARPGWTSGKMSAEIKWKPPTQPKPRSLPKGTNKYKEVLKLGALFFAAQRSGHIPDNSPVPWRRSSHVNDTVPGGWYDAGDTLKINFPMSVAVAFNAWAMVSFPRAFEAAGAKKLYLDQLRVANDFMLGCYDEANKKFIAQIGHPNIDHNYWGRPEENNNQHRPAFVYDDTMHASDLLSNVAAAWASSSLAFRDTDPAYANLLKAKAKSIYAWAISKPGKYSDYYKDAIYSIYPSWDYIDSQIWAAAWLYRCSGQYQYLYDAEKFWKSNQDDADIYPGWDSLWAPAAVVLRQIRRMGHNVPGIQMYDDFYETFYLPSWLKCEAKNEVACTPGGMAYPSWNIWANLQFATTTAMVMLQDVKDNKMLAERAAQLAYARRQVDYALGSNGRSFIVGWGANPPRFAHHAPASCPDMPNVCNAQNYHMRAANGQTIYGGMVGGPAGKKKFPNNPDYYADNRNDWVMNEVAVDYNSGLAGALAGMWAYSNQLPK